MLLNNFGSTCYINSVLQIFLNNKNFMKYLNTKEYNINYLLHSLKLIDNNETLRLFLIRFQEKLGNKLVVNNQNDAYETYTLLLDIFEKEDEESVLFFIGKQKKILKCLKCNNKREVKTNFTSFNLYISDKNINLQTSFLETLSKEVLDGIECEYCKTKEKTEVKNKIVKWPQNLVFIINRYSLDGKINESFDYTKFIELSIDGKIIKYSLYGIVNHYGMSNSGHYTFIKLESNSYIEIDDSNVKNTQNYKSNNNYMLIYNNSN